jgi:transaldolase
MKATLMLHDLGQSLWLDNITRDLLDSGTLKRYIDELSVTELTSNPTIFDHAIKNSTAYDAAIRQKVKKARRERHCSSSWPWKTSPGQPTSSVRYGTGRTGWTAGCRSRCRRSWPTTRQVRSPPRRICTLGAGRPNLLIKIPGTKEGLPAIEEAIFSGIPVNVTLLFSREHYRAAAEAFMRGIERPAALQNQLGIAIAKRTYKAARDLLGSSRWHRAYNAGARPQRPLWASTRHQGSSGFRRTLHQVAGCAAHREHHAGRHSPAARRPWRPR